MSPRPAIYLRATPELKALVLAASEADGRSEASYCRQRLQVAAEKDLGISLVEFTAKKKRKK